MKIFRNIEQYLVGHLCFPITNALYNRRGIPPRYRQLLHTQFASQESLRALQFGALRSQIVHAGLHVPYYRRLFSRLGFDPAHDLKSLEDLRHIPPLSRADLIEHHLDLVDERWRQSALHALNLKRTPGQPIPLALFRGKTLVRNTSSGSTGAPTVFFENGSITASNWANELRLRNWFALQPGAREARMARLSPEYLRKSSAVILRKLIWNQLLLPGINLKDSDYAQCARELESFQPRILWGYTSAATGLATWLKEHPGAVPFHRPDLVITWAGPLYEHEKMLLEESLATAVTNIYGTREVGHIAGRCPRGHFHVNQESVYLESEMDGSSDSIATPSELLATSLIPSPMPFIRYRTGDLGILRESQCTCGRSLQEIAELTGRTGEIFHTAGGQMISPNFWCRIFMDPRLSCHIRRFQVVYRAKDSILVRIVRGPGYTEELEKHLRRGIQRSTFDCVTIDFQYPAEIAAQISGKYQMVVNETGAEGPTAIANT